MAELKITILICVSILRLHEMSHFCRAWTPTVQKQNHFAGIGSPTKKSAPRVALLAARNVSETRKCGGPLNLGPGN